MIKDHPTLKHELANHALPGAIAHPICPVVGATRHDEFICETDNREMLSFRKQSGILSRKLFGSFDECGLGRQIL
jgi:hypothetical protein